MADPTNDEEARPLRPAALRLLRLGELRPAGWLAGQLCTQADGMAGHLDEVWPGVGRSGWIGGGADSWERGPYWLDGVVPLAYLLEDEELCDKVEHWVDVILDRQREDGWLGPDGSDVWPRMIVLKALLQHWSATGDGRVMPAALALADYLQTLLADRPLRDWGRFRWAELVRCLHEVYDATGEDRVLRLAETVRAQGYDWHAYAGDLPYREKRSREQLLDEVVITVSVDQPVAFPLRLRVPGWARAPEVVEGADAATSLTAGTVHTLARTWAGVETVRLRLPVDLVVDRRYAGSATVRRGPLVFALAVAESWQRRGEDSAFPGWEVHPAGPWNYALELDPCDPGALPRSGALGCRRTPLLARGRPHRASRPRPAAAGVGTPAWCGRLPAGEPGSHG